MKCVLCFVVIIFVTTKGCNAKLLTGKENALLPRLYHLDDYERCLAAPKGDGLYCMGTFHLTPMKPDHHAYRIMEESSKDPLNFNRTLIHRGYCVSSRCPLVPGQKFNDTRRFEECIAHWARMLDYKSTSVTIEFCKSAKQANITNNLDTSKTLFLVVILFILFCNVVGTIYDVQTSNVKKNPFVVCWSWKDNWRRLTAPSDDADPKRASLLPTHGFRVIILLLVMCIHCGLIHFKLYSQNPQYLEKMMRDPIILLTRNGTAVVCVFLMLSNFLLARRMLQQQVSVKNPFLMCLLHRIARISPLYLLNVWWAATWLKELGDGPLWISNIHAEADICWNKLWTHALFINNLVDTHNHCLVQTWFLAVDMQLYVVSCALILTLTTVRMKNLIILGMIFLASCLLNGTLSYVFGWKSMLFITNTENLRTVFKGVPSFINLYITPWGSLPTSIMGVSLAYLDIHLQETGFKFTEHKVLSWLHRFSIPLVIMTVWVGAQAVDAEGGGVLQAGYAALDRTVICAFAAILLLGMSHQVPSVTRQMMSWHGWVVLSRLSLPALLLHWSVTITGLARLNAPTASYYTIFWGAAATVSMTYLLSVPLSLCVEMPVQRMVTELLMRCATVTTANAGGDPHSKQRFNNGSITDKEVISKKKC